jgi:methylthioribose-1-phosphate isomerase
MAVKTIEWKNDRVIMLDQRLLPHKEVYRICRDYQQVAEAIRGMGERRGFHDGINRGAEPEPS